MPNRVLGSGVCAALPQLTCAAIFQSQSESIERSCVHSPLRFRFMGPLSQQFARLYFIIQTYKKQPRAGTRKGPHEALAEWEMSARPSHWLQVGFEKLQRRRMDKCYTRSSNEHVIWHAKMKLKGRSPDFLNLAVFFLITILTIFTRTQY
jgi:hypothetical protein